MPQHIFSKIGMAQPKWQHQRIMRNIIVNYYKGTKQKLELIPAAEFQNEANNLAPDLLFIDGSNTIVCIEIDHSQRLTEIKRILRLQSLLADEPTLQEVFFYNYVTGEIFGYSDTSKDIGAFSTVLNVDILALTKSISKKISGLDKMVC